MQNRQLGNSLDGAYREKHSQPYQREGGIGLGPQNFFDPPDQANFPPARVDPRKSYRAVMIYRVAAAC